MAKTDKGKDSQIARLEEAVKRLRDREKKRIAAAKARAAGRRYDAATWKGPAPAPLGVYYIRVMLDASNRKDVEDIQNMTFANNEG